MNLLQSGYGSMKYLGLLMLFGSSTHAQDLVFTEIARPMGLSLPNTLNESVAWGDYDNDGDQDLYLTCDGPNYLFRNDGPGGFTDVTSQAGVGNGLFSVGVAFGDLDNDGDLDLYVVNFQTGPDVLYRNNGDSTFTDITQQAGTTDETSSRGVTLLDYDRDGLLDIYVNAIGPDILYHNLGNLTFENTTGLLGEGAPGLGVGVVATDLNGDGWPDLYNGNRSETISNLWINQNGTFTDVAGDAGVTASGLGMGVLAFDYNNDTLMDLYWTTWPGENPPTANALYENQGDLTFLEKAVETGVSDPSGWGISCNAADVDNDGFIDFFVTNGFSSDTGPNVLFRNTNGSFENITEVLGGGSFDGRGVAFADFDQDGDQDLVVTGGPESDTRFWRNDTANGSHFVTFHLQGRLSNASAIGARVLLTAGGITQLREVSGGAGRGSFNSLPVMIGLGSSCVADTVRILWPSGEESFYENLTADRIYRVVEPQATDPGELTVLKSVAKGSCVACETPVSVIPWVVDNNQWTSRIAVYNNHPQQTPVCLRALDREGNTWDVTVTIPPHGLYAGNAAELFPGMSGYSLFLSGPEDQLHTSFLTFNKESPSGASPSQTTAPPLSQLTDKLLFGYLPGNENPAVVLCAPSTSEDAVVVKMELLGASGDILSQRDLTLQGNRPLAVLITDLFDDAQIPQHAAVKATAYNGDILAGTTFVFNLFREPSMGRAFSL